MERVRVHVPATSANMGAGFDCLGIAIDLTTAVAVRKADAFSIVIRGHGEGVISTGPENHVNRAIQAVYRRLDRPMPPLAIEIDNNIPIERGLGSSAAAVAAGLVAGNMLNGAELDWDELIHLGAEIEGHPDNVAPALIGGCVIATKTGSEFAVAQVPVGPDLSMVLFIPDFPIPTSEARKVLPDLVPRVDAVFNASRTALLVLALSTEQYDYLPVAMEDRLHQPYRQTIYPAMRPLFNAALEAGAFGVFLSGSGSSICAFAVGNEDVVARAFEDASQRLNVPGTVLVTRPSNQGAQVEFAPLQG